MDTTVTLAPDFVDYLGQVLLLVIQGVLAIGLPIVIAYAVKKFGLQIEQEKRDALQTTFTNAAGGLLQKLGEDAKNLKIDVHNPDVAAAVNRALKGAPEALEWAGLSREEIAKRILEKIPQVSSTI